MSDVSISIRVWERYRLAQRVAERAKTGDSLGDPRELLEKYHRLLSKYAEREHQANRWLALNAEIIKLQSGSHDPEKLKQLKIERDGGGAGSGTFVNHGSEIGSYLAVHGFKALQRTAQTLCFAILQQLVVPPKIRKSIEVASKFWARNPRLYPKGQNHEESIAKRVELYMEHLDLFQKHESLFELAIKEGKPHSETGDLVTMLKAGPFTIVNTGGFDPKVMEEKARLSVEAADKMAAIGLGKVCYGNVLITNRLSGDKIQAFYMPANDEMFVRADAKVTLDTVRVICHELTHRLEFKFLQSKKSEIVRLYSKINTHSMLGTKLEDFPKKGDSVEYKGKTLKVTDVDFRRQKIRLQTVGEDMSYAVPIETYNNLKGLPRSKNPLGFVTPYAKRGGPSENFAEMVSFWAIGQLPKEQVELLVPIVS